MSPLEHQAGLLALLPLPYRRQVAVRRRVPGFRKPRTRIIVLLRAFVLPGCNGDRLKSDTKPTAVALLSSSVANLLKQFGCLLVTGQLFASTFFCLLISVGDEPVWAAL